MLVTSKSESEKYGDDSTQQPVQFTDNELKKLKEMFMMFDVDESGVLGAKSLSMPGRYEMERC